MSDLQCLSSSAAKVSFKRVVAASRIVTESGALEKVAAMRQAKKALRGAGGRPATVSDRAILVLLLLLALDHQALQLTRATSLVRNNLGQDSLRYLQLAGFDRLSEANVYDRFFRAVQRWLDPIDGFTGPKRERLTYAEYEAIKAGRSTEHVDALNDAMHVVFNDLVMSSVLTHGSDLLTAADGNVAFDGTFVRAGGARGTDSRGGKYVSSEYDAGRYYRDGDHTGADLDAKVRKATKNQWGYELTLATLVDNVVVGRDGGVTTPSVPHVVLGVAFDGAARQPGRNAHRALLTIPRHGLPVNLAIGDRAYYAGAKVENFHTLVGDLGFKPVTDYKDDQLGTQDSYRGALQVEGWWYCPCMPDGLISATRDYRAGTIDLTTYQQRLAARIQYAATRKARADADGNTRWSHPSGIGHRCDKTRPNADLFCTQKTLSIPREAGQKLTQEFVYGSTAWKGVYGLRSTVESSNAGLKDGSTHNLAEKSRRRIRGRSAQFLLAALVVMARNVEILLEFKRRQDDPERALQVARKKALRKKTPYNFRSVNDDEREAIEQAMSTRT